MVLVGQVGREIVGLLNEHGPLAVGMSGEDAHLFTAERRDAVHEGEPIDVGLVGDVVTVRPEAVEDLIGAGTELGHGVLRLSSDGALSRASISAFALGELDLDLHGHRLAVDVAVCLPEKQPS